MSLRQTWSQLTLTPMEDDLPDILSYVLYDESRMYFLREFVRNFKHSVSKDTLKESAKLITNVSQHMKDIVNPSILDVLFEIKDFNIDVFGLKNHEFIVRKGNPKIISNPTLPRHMNIQELYTYFKISNSEALLTLVKSFPASLEQRFIQDIPKLKLIPSIYLYIKEKDLFKNIDYKELLKPLERTEQMIDYSMMFLDFMEPVEHEESDDFKFYSYSNQSSDEYKTRLSIFRHLNIGWNAEIVNYLKEHQLYEFLYTRVLTTINNHN